MCGNWCTNQAKLQHSGGKFRITTLLAFIAPPRLLKSVDAALEAVLACALLAALAHTDKPRCSNSRLSEVPLERRGGELRPRSALESAPSLGTAAAFAASPLLPAGPPPAVFLMALGCFILMFSVRPSNSCPCSCCRATLASSKRPNVTAAARCITRLPATIRCASPSLMFSTSPYWENNSSTRDLFQERGRSNTSIRALSAFSALGGGGLPSAAGVLIFRLPLLRVGYPPFFPSDGSGGGGMEAGIGGGGGLEALSGGGE
mmetsp:Transcript_72524/g.135479  ORF Transcript_72524/g.135479 Transcript_72524/m.135479 type:complete len:261 (-) Transcript_72524:680-1462(-)